MPTFDLSNLSDLELFDRLAAARDEYEKAADVAAKNRIMREKVAPVSAELTRRYPPVPDELGSWPTDPEEG